LRLISERRERGRQTKVVDVSNALLLAGPQNLAELVVLPGEIDNPR